MVPCTPSLVPDALPFVCGPGGRRGRHFVSGLTLNSGNTAKRLSFSRDDACPPRERMLGRGARTGTLENLRQGPDPCSQAGVHLTSGPGWRGASLTGTKGGLSC